MPKRTTLPPGPFGQVEGWLGVAVEPAGPAWRPKQGGALAVPAPVGWDEVSEGATFAGQSAAGPLALTFTGVREVSWGCGTAVPAATFDAVPAPPPGVVRITDEPAPGTATRPADARPPTASRRLFALPFGGELDLQPGRSLVELGGARPFVDTWEVPAGLDLRLDDAVGPAWPELAVSDGETLVLVLRRHAVGEVEWDVLRVAGRVGTMTGAVRVRIGDCTERTPTGP